MAKSRIKQLLNGELDIDHFMDTKGLEHVFGKDIYTILNEHYNAYRRKEITKEMFTLELLLCLSQHSEDFDKLLSLLEKLRKTPSLNDENNTISIVR